MTVLAPFDAAQDLYDQLLRQREPGDYSDPLFTVEEIEAFASYCMDALVSCPEDVRQHVVARVTRTQRERNRSLYAHQSIYLNIGALNVEKWSDDDQHARMVARDSPASVDLQKLLDSQDSYARAMFISTLKVIEEQFGIVTVAFGDGGTFFDDNGYLLAAQRWTTAEDLADFCKEIGAKLRKKYPVQRAGRLLEFGPWGIRLVNEKTVEAEHIVQYAQKIALFLSYADELESAGWSPEYLSLNSYGRLCTWLFEHGSDSVPIRS